MRATARLWRTEDGALVLDADPKATSLAYGEDDEIEEADQAAAKKALGKGADKQAEKPQDKKAEPPANKATRPRKKS